MGSQKLRNIRNYHFRNSRALDVARWDYHFEGGTAQAVLKALACYQNPDGGFAHGLEPDIRTTESNPMSTWTATRILRELALPELADNMVDKIMDYLAQSLSPNKRWPATISAHNSAPHAPWFTHTEGGEFWSWNPTIELAAFILSRGRQKHLALYTAAEAIVREALLDIMKPDFVPQANELSNLCEAGVILSEFRPDLLPGDF